jgi:hypothetical protein
MQHLFSNPVVAFVLFGGTYMAAAFFPSLRGLSRQLRWNRLSGVSTGDFVACQFFWGAGVYAVVLALLSLLGATDEISGTAILAAGAGGGAAALIDRYLTRQPPGRATGTRDGSAV